MESKLIYKLEDRELEHHLKVFLDRINPYLDILKLDINKLERLKREQLAFSWLMDMGRKLTEYHKEISGLLKMMRRKEPPDHMSLLKFYDLPRPPLFYSSGDVAGLFNQIVMAVKASKFYADGIGRDLGIEHLEVLSE